MAGGMIWSFEMDEWCKFEWVTSITGSRVGYMLIEDTKPVERRERINYAETRPNLIHNANPNFVDVSHDFLNTEKKNKDDVKMITKQSK
ncbi:hypothetical protein V9T40_011430 [Parthenolecanium corni]|uniref:Uncharacterized protein n=1 Tax=Parthenolecanium corni TaxID=536013 RepID=A0AAN9T8Y7_9HEMI